MRIRTTLIPALKSLRKPQTDLSLIESALHQACKAILTFAFAFAASSPSWSQIPILNNSTATPVPGSDRDYIKMLAETVDPASGSVSIRVNVPIPKGRGPTLPFSFAYDSGSALYPAPYLQGTLFWQTAQTQTRSFLMNGGWGYSVPQQSYTTFSITSGSPPVVYTCTFYQNFIFQDPSGARHSLPLGTITASRTGACGNTQSVPTGSDGVYSASLVGVNTTRVADPDGTVYYFSGNHYLNTTGGFVTIPDTIEDRNGNTITLTNLDSGSTPGAFTAVDTLGRTVLSSSGFGSTGNTLTVAGLANPYIFTWGTTSTNFTVTSTLVSSQEPPCNPALSSARIPGVMWL